MSRKARVSVSFCVVTEGAYADLLLVDGNPLENLDLVADPAKNFVLIVKDANI